MVRICVHVGRLLMGEAKPRKRFAARGARALICQAAAASFGKKERARAHLSLSHSLDLAACRILFFSNKCKQLSSSTLAVIRADRLCWNSGAAWRLIVMAFRHFFIHACVFLFLFLIVQLYYTLLCVCVCTAPEKNEFPIQLNWVIDAMSQLLSPKELILNLLFQKSKKLSKMNKLVNNKSNPQIN
jgi:hypothetical protein